MTAVAEHDCLQSMVGAVRMVFPCGSVGYVSDAGYSIEATVAVKLIKFNAIPVNITGPNASQVCLMM